MLFSPLALLLHGDNFIRNHYSKDPFIKEKAATLSIVLTRRVVVTVLTMSNDQVWTAQLQQGERAAAGGRVGVVRGLGGGPSHPRRHGQGRLAVRQGLPRQLPPRAGLH